jgi:hypothetical protein
MTVTTAPTAPTAATATATAATDTGAATRGRPPVAPAPVGRWTYLRRRVTVVALAIVLVFLATVAVGRVTAGAELEDAVAGHAVVRPGETLWDVAVATAPDGVDPRQQLEDLRVLNGLDGGVEAWTTVLIPAR